MPEYLASFFIDIFFALFLRRKADMAPDKKKKKKSDLNDLKRELELDEHKVLIDELYRRYSSNPKTVILLLVSCIWH